MSFEFNNPSHDGRQGQEGVVDRGMRLGMLNRLRVIT